ncbi:MAG TPA: RNA polymerase sigma factor [Acidimicrobiia bacterium]
MEPGGAHDGEVIAASLAEPPRFTEIFDRHFAAVFSYCVRRLGRSFGEDVASASFVEAFVARGRFDQTRASARPWLLGIATNLVRRHHRAEQRRVRAYSRAHEPETDDQASRDDRVQAQLLAPQLAAALSQLTSDDKDVLLLYAWAELSYQEIADALQIPVGTVRSRLHRARGIVRTGLEQETTRGASQ